MKDFTREPIWYDAESSLPVEFRRGNPTRLSPVVQDLSDRISGEFRLLQDGRIKNPNGRLPGWNGDYYSAQDIQTTGERLIVYTDIVKVSDDFASAHYNLRRYGNHEKNPISTMGAYLTAFTRDSKGNLSILVYVRQETSFVDPKKLNAPGSAVPINDRESPVELITKKVARTFNLDLNTDTCSIIPMGVLKDGMYNTSLLMNYALIPEESIGRNSSLIKIPAEDFDRFFSANGIDKWHIPGFFAVCKALIYVSRTRYDMLRFPEKYARIGEEMLEREFSRLWDKPLKLRSVVSDWGIETL